MEKQEGEAILTGGTAGGARRRCLPIGPAAGPSYNKNRNDDDK